MATIMEALTMLSSSATSAFPGGGAGDGAGVTRTVITRTVTATMATDTMAPATMAPATALATDMILIGPVRSTALQANQGWLSCSADSPALAIIMALLTGSWGPRRGEQFGLTSATMEMWADRPPIFSQRI